MKPAVHPTLPMSTAIPYQGPQGSLTPRMVKNSMADKNPGTGTVISQATAIFSSSIRTTPDLQLNTRKKFRD